MYSETLLTFARQKRRGGRLFLVHRTEACSERMHPSHHVSADARSVSMVSLQLSGFTSVLGVTCLYPAAHVCFPAHPTMGHGAATTFNDGSETS